MLCQRRLIAVVASFLIGCAVLVAGGSGVRAGASQEEQHTEATNEGQGRSPGAASEESRCEETRTVVRLGAGYATNDVPGCPKGGPLVGTDRASYLYGGEGEDEIRGLGSPDRQFDELWGGDSSDILYGGAGADFLYGGLDDDVLYGGDGGDILLVGGKGEDVIYGGDGIDFMGDAHGEDVLYGGDGNDHLDALQLGLPPKDGGRDKLYCGKGKDRYSADKNDYVDSSCEKGTLVDTGGPPLILLAYAALLLGSGLMMSRYVIRRASS